MQSPLGILPLLLIGLAALAVAERDRLARAEGGEREGGSSRSLGVPAESRASTGPTGLGGLLGGLRAGEADSARARATEGRRGEMRSEQGLARDAVSRGLVQPLDSILSNVETTVPGSVLSARLKKGDDGVWIYRLVILSPEGRYRNVIVDAARNTILQIR